MLNLNEVDRQAVDLLLDAGFRGIAATQEPVATERLAAARKVLDTLALLPAEEPPADLAQRTLRLIERADAREKSPDDTHFAMPVPQG